MAVALTLSPFPPATQTTTRAAAIDYLQEQCGGRCADDDTACQLGQLASEIVELTAPAAPQTIRNEAVTRIVGYLASSDYGARSQESEGSLQTSHVTNHGDLLRRCGAEALLSQWHVLSAEFAE